MSIIKSNNLMPSMSMLWPNEYSSLMTELIILIEKKPKKTASELQQILYEKAKSLAKE